MNAPATEPAAVPVPLGSGIDFTDPTSPLAPYYLQASHVAAALLVAVLFVVFSLVVPLWHAEFWSSLEVGSWIAAHRALPQTEPFSPFADPDRPYVASHWLSQLLFHSVFRAGAALAGGDLLQQQAGGAELVRALHGLAIALRFAFLIAAYRAWTRSLPWACFGALVAVYLTLANNMLQRPLVFGELAFAAALWLAVGRLRAWALAAIAVVFTLWANLHDSFIAGLAVLALFLVGRAIESARRTGAWDVRAVWRDRRARRLALALVIASSAVCINPYGADLYAHVFQHANNENVRGLTAYLPLDFWSGASGHQVYMAILIALAAAQALSPRGLTPTALLLLVGFGVGPLLQRRLFLWWAPLVPLLLLPLLQSVVLRLGLGRLRWESVPSLRKTLVVLALGAVAVAWTGAAQLIAGRTPPPLERVVSTGTPLPVAFHLNSAYQRQWPPLAQALAAYPDRRLVGRIFASENLAGYLHWALQGAPTTDLVLYHPPECFPREHWQDCMAVLDGAVDWWDVLERYQVNLIVLEAHERPKLAARLRDAAGWHVVLDDSGGPKPDPRNRLLIAVRKRPL